jgi:hypothetical protein
MLTAPPPTHTHRAPHRDYDEGRDEWVWAREAPASQKAPGGGDAVKKLKKKVRLAQHRSLCKSAPVQQLFNSLMNSSRGCTVADHVPQWP